jgi:hypothetical protein
MPNRRKLGATYVRSPIQNIREGTTVGVAKVLFGILYSIIYLIALYIIVGIVVFLGIHFADIWEDGTSTFSVFNSPYCLPWQIGGIVCVFLYVFKDNLRKR